MSFQVGLMGFKLFYNLLVDTFSSTLWITKKMQLVDISENVFVFTSSFHTIEKDSTIVRKLGPYDFRNVGFVQALSVVGVEC